MYQLIWLFIHCLPIGCSSISNSHIGIPCSDLTQDFEEVIDMTNTSATNILKGMYKPFNICCVVFILLTLLFFVCYAVDYNDLGDPKYLCQFFGALFWYEECSQKHRVVVNPNFYVCCSGGKIQLAAVLSTPTRLFELIFDGKKGANISLQIFSPIIVCFVLTPSEGK